MQFLCILFVPALEHSFTHTHTHTHTHTRMHSHSHTHSATQPASVLKGQELLNDPMRRLHYFGPKTHGSGGLWRQKVSWESQLCQLGHFADTGCNLPFQDAFFTKKIIFLKTDSRSHSKLSSVKLEGPADTAECNSWVSNINIYTSASFPDYCDKML